MILVRAEQFAIAMGIGLRSAQLAYQRSASGKRWRGHVLPVIKIPGQQGGNGGETWSLVADLLPSPLREELALKATVTTPFETPFEGGVQAPVADWQIEKAVERHKIIAPILAAPKRTAKRGKKLKQVSTSSGLSESTLRRWVKSMEDGGISALMPKQPESKGERRVLITRKWDAECGLSVEEKRRIAKALEEVARGLVIKRKSMQKIESLCSCSPATDDRRCWRDLIQACAGAAMQAKCQMDQSRSGHAAFARFSRR